MGGDERGQDADPLVHAVRVRDVLQLDGLGALLGDLPELGHDLTVAGIAGADLLVCSS